MVRTRVAAISLESFRRNSRTITRATTKLKLQKAMATAVRRKVLANVQRKKDAKFRSVLAILDARYESAAASEY